MLLNYPLTFASSEIEDILCACSPHAITTKAICPQRQALSGQVRDAKPTVLLKSANKDPSYKTFPAIYNLIVVP